MLTTWPESTRNSYALNCWAVLEHVGLARRPGEYLTSVCDDRILSVACSYGYFGCS